MSAAPPGPQAFVAQLRSALYSDETYHTVRAKIPTINPAHEFELSLEDDVRRVLDMRHELISSKSTFVLRVLLFRTMAIHCALRPGVAVEKGFLYQLAEILDIPGPVRTTVMAIMVCKAKEMFIKDENKKGTRLLTLVEGLGTLSKGQYKTVIVPLLEAAEHWFKQRCTEFGLECMAIAESLAQKMGEPLQKAQYARLVATLLKAAEPSSSWDCVDAGSECLAVAGTLACGKVGKPLSKTQYTTIISMLMQAADECLTDSRNCSAAGWLRAAERLSIKIDQPFGKLHYRVLISGLLEMAQYRFEEASTVNGLKYLSDARGLAAKIGEPLEQCQYARLICVLQRTAERFLKQGYAETGSECLAAATSLAADAEVVTK